MGLAIGFNPAESGKPVISGSGQAPARPAPSAGPAAVYQTVPVGGVGVATAADAAGAQEFRSRFGGQPAISGPGAKAALWLGSQLLKLFAKNPQAAKTAVRIGTGAGAALGTGTLATTGACDPGAIFAATAHACSDLQNILNNKNATHASLGLQPVVNRETNRVSLNNFIKDKAEINWDYLRLPVVDFVVEEESPGGYTIFALVFDRDTYRFEITAIKINKKYAPNTVWSDNLSPSHGIGEFATNQNVQLIRSSNQVGSLFLVRSVMLDSRETREIAYWSGNAEGGLAWTTCETPIANTSTK